MIFIYLKRYTLKNFVVYYIIIIIEFKIKEKKNQKNTRSNTQVLQNGTEHSSIVKTRNISIFASAVDKSNSIKTTKPYCLHIVN